MTEKEKLRILREVDATMRMENMPLTAEDKRRLKSIADKKTTTKKEIEKILRNYKGFGHIKAEPDNHTEYTPY